MTLEEFLKLPRYLSRRRYGRVLTYTWVSVSGLKEIPNGPKVENWGGCIDAGDPWPMLNPPKSEITAALAKKFCEVCEHTSEDKVLLARVVAEAKTDREKRLLRKNRE